jgi:hypothetical protein
MVERYRATGAMPSEGDALGRLGLGGMEASAHNQAVRRAHAMIRGMCLKAAPFVLPVDQGAHLLLLVLHWKI